MSPFSSPDLGAQSAPLLTLSTLTEAQLSATQLSRKEKYQDSPYAAQVRLVEIGDLPALQQDGVLTFSIPDSPQAPTYSFRARQVRAKADGDYIWVGELVSTLPCTEDSVENDCSFGFLHLVKKDADVFGALQIDSLNYRIRALGGGLSALIDWNTPSSLAEPDCAMPEGETVEERGSSGESYCPVKVLVLYTEAAQEAHPDILNTIDLSIVEANHVLDRSEVSVGQLVFVLAGTELLSANEFEESGQPEDRFDIATNPFITAHRDAYQADVVVVMTDAVYDDFNGAVTDFGDDETDEANAFAIVEAEFAIAPNFTFTHEMGHLFGARHEGTDICPGAGDDSGQEHAHGWIIEKGINFLFLQKKYFKTVMSVCAGQTIPRIPNFSNPDVKFKNKKTGKEGSNNNAKIMRDEACRVANYRIGEVPYVYIEGPGLGCPNQAVPLEGFITGDVPLPHQYSWEVSYDGGFNFEAPVTSSYPYFAPDMPETVGALVAVRLTAGNVNGPMDVAWHEIVVDNTEINCMRQSHAGQEQSAGPDHIVLTPNPSTGTVAVAFPVLPGQPYSIILSDALGRTMRTIRAFAPGSSPGRETLMLQDSDFPAAGLYWLRCAQPGGSQTARLVRLR